MLVSGATVTFDFCRTTQNCVNCGVAYSGITSANLNNTDGEVIYLFPLTYTVPTPPTPMDITMASSTLASPVPIAENVLTTQTAPVGCTILPVELISFNAHVNHNVVLSWITATEENNDYFAIERSTDGLNFNTIGGVAGAGTTIEEKHYSYTDVDAKNSGNTLFYYRLKQVDFDGSFAYSNMEVVAFELNNKLIIQQVGFSKIFRVIFPVEEGIKSIEIYNMNGQLMKQEIRNGDTIEEIDLTAFTSGIYLIRINNMLTEKIAIR